MRSAYTFVACCVLSTGVASSAFAQGFNTFNGRNHPELDWQTAQTPHFTLVYPAHLSGIETEAAAVAESAYDVLSANLGVSFEERIRIYLSDEDEITNGFAVGLGGGYTDIWVNANAVVDEWTGREKWLRKVIAHELTHLFQFRAVRSGPLLFSIFVGDPLPTEWSEGLAQYETEEWDALRGDRWLRTAILDEQLSYDDDRSAWNGRLLYALGNSQVRFFAEQYGDSALTALLGHRRSMLFGLVKTYDFSRAFRAVTGTPYRDFYERWRRHTNVYYNTLAGQMETAASLGADDPLSLPGEYLYDVQYSPDTTRIAVLSLVSARRPVRRLNVVDRQTKGVVVVAEGDIAAPVSWSPDGRRLAFARRARGANGSLLYDLFVVDADGGNLRRLTESRRASAPTFAPDGERLAFVGSQGGTANLFLLDLDTRDQRRLTDFTGDVQLGSARWHPSEDRIAFARFDAAGARTLTVFDLASGEAFTLSDGKEDDRNPVWSPDGAFLAYTSLRDHVPNVFVYELATGEHRRVARLVTGTTAHDWLPADSAHAAGTLIVVSGVTKSGDQAYRIDAARTATTSAPVAPREYTSWTEHRPPAQVPAVVPPDAGLISSRAHYHSFRNVRHFLSLGLPYYSDRGDWGVTGFTSWTDPLAKHQFVGLGSVSIPDPLGSFFTASYVNNRWSPSLSLNIYRFPGSVRSYGDAVLAERFSGGDVGVSWPLDWGDHPWASTRLGLRARFADIEPLNPEDFDQTVDDLPPPEGGRQVDLQLSFVRRWQRPYRDNVVHPLDGAGVRLLLTGATGLFDTEADFLRGDVAAFGVLPGPGLSRLFVYGRAQVQTGSPLAQDVIGLSRRDQLQLSGAGLGVLSFGDAERVRGYRSYAVGSRVLFGSIEYRVPLVADLRTRVLGLVSLGATTLAAFSDAGLVWTGGGARPSVRRVGVGLELKNALRVGGGFEIMHALGVARPASELGSEGDSDVYYRIRAAVPF